MLTAKEFIDGLMAQTDHRKAVFYIFNKYDELLLESVKSGDFITENFTVCNDILVQLTAMIDEIPFGDYATSAVAAISFGASRHLPARAAYLNAAYARCFSVDPQKAERLYRGLGDGSFMASLPRRA